jgi:hypothetical protein
MIIKNEKSQACEGDLLSKTGQERRKIAFSIQKGIAVLLFPFSNLVAHRVGASVPKWTEMEDHFLKNLFARRANHKNSPMILCGPYGSYASSLVINSSATSKIKT